MQKFLIPQHSLYKRIFLSFILVHTSLVPRLPTHQEPGYKAQRLRTESQPFSIDTRHYHLSRSFFSRWYWDIIWRWRGHHQHWADRPWVVEGCAQAGWILWTLSCKLRRTDSVKLVNCVQSNVTGHAYNSFYFAYLHNFYDVILLTHQYWCCIHDLLVVTFLPSAVNYVEPLFTF